MNIIIVGQGAIGLLLYAKLSQNQSVTPQNITLLPSKSITFPDNSFSFTSLMGEETKIPIKTSTHDDLVTADLVIVCVKAYHLKSALLSLQSIPTDTPIILCHNGKIVLEEVVNGKLNKNPIMLLLTTHGSRKHDLSTITHTGSGQSDLGLLNGQLASKNKDDIFEYLKNALTGLSWQDNILEKQWLKLAINCVINPITAINNIDNGKVNSHEFHQLKYALINEVIAVAKTEDVKLEEKELFNTITNVAQSTATNCSSMRTDILKKQNTEIDFINGYIVKLGKLHNIPTPANTSMWQAVNLLAKQP